MINKQKSIGIVFEFSHYNRDEDGNIESIAFLDDRGTEIILFFNPLNDYSNNIEVFINEELYLKNKGKLISPEMTIKILSLADNKEIIISKPLNEDGKEKAFKFLFRRGKVNPYFNEKTQESYNLHKFFDSAQNYIYFREDHFPQIFGTEGVEDFVFLSLTYSAYLQALKKTQIRYPWMNTALLTIDLLTRVERVDTNEYDLNILKQIFSGQRRGDPKYDGTFEEVYLRIREERNERETKKLTFENFDYQIIPVDQIKAEGTTVNKDEKDLIKEELNEAYKRITDLENRLGQLEKENRELKRLKDMVNGEDSEYFATIHPVKKA